MSDSMRAILVMMLGLGLFAGCGQPDSGDARDSMASLQKFVDTIPADFLPRGGTDGEIERIKANKWINENLIGKRIEIRNVLNDVTVRENGASYYISATFGKPHMDKAFAEVNNDRNLGVVGKVRCGGTDWSVYLTSAIWPEVDEDAAKRLQDLRGSTVTLRFTVAPHCLIATTGFEHGEEPIKNNPQNPFGFPSEVLLLNPSNTVIDGFGAADDGENPRNPFGVRDISGPDDKTAQDLATIVKLTGDKNDPNAEQWVKETTTGKKGSIEGTWCDRWGSDLSVTGSGTEIKVVGDRVYMLINSATGKYLVDLKRDQNRLVGKYKGIENPGIDTGPCFFLVVDDERIDGVYGMSGTSRWDLRRKLK